VSTGALAGVRVLDLTRYIPGPYCTLLLGDLGADVVKVETPGLGDPTRAVPPQIDGDGALHAALNRNKRSIALDIRTPDGLAAVKRLAQSADVLVESFRPGVLARRGLGAEELRASNPRLVYCSISGYGQTGPLAPRAGHDLDYVALGGLLGSNRDAAGRPVIPTVQLGDMAGGLVAALAILAALVAREKTGAGQVVDVSLLHAVLALMTLPAARLLAGGGLANELTGTHACYNVYACRDGRHLAVGALEPKFWEALCRALGLGELVARQWSGPQAQGEMIATLGATFAGRDRDEWLRELGGIDACVEPVLDLSEALAAMQPTPANPVRLSATPPTMRRAAPALGEHTAAVLAEAGYGADEVERLRAAGVVA
jgi:crotonobetainyl-CoA:carnitine CoA-transferase CaiB-like acyl-CoA transferase